MQFSFLLEIYFSLRIMSSYMTLLSYMCDNIMETGNVATLENTL
jgi:hypothetical protein